MERLTTRDRAVKEGFQEEKVLYRVLKVKVHVEKGKMTSHTG